MAKSLAKNPGWIKNQPSPYQKGDLTHFPDWQTTIILDAFFNNWASGMMIVTSLLYWFGPHICVAMTPLALTLTLFLVLFDLFLLVVDLGDSWRFYHCLRVMRFTSPLSVGVWGLISFTTFLVFACFFQWIIFALGPATPYPLILLAKLFTVMAFIGAVVVICYKGVVFSCSSQPGVSQARWLTSFMVSDSLLMGIALYLLMAIFCGAGYNTMTIVMPFAFLVVARCVTFWLLWLDVRKRAREMYLEENRLINLSVYILAGIVPFILVFCGLWGIIFSSLLVLANSYFERHWIIGLTHPRKD